MKLFLTITNFIENYFLKIVNFLKKFLAHFALIALILEQFIFVASATAQALPIIPDGSTNTQITQTASGIDQINIAPPSANGVSHNKYEDYNVNVAGQVINNFSGKNPAEIVAGADATAVTQTQIAGLVVANPNLNSSGSAKIILNEVSSGNVSQLLGYVEIAGTNADLILANPNGFTCRGCGFINTARLLMIAGKSDFDANGNLGFNLKEQIDPNLYVPLITIDGLGLDASRVAGTEIVASSLKLLASIYGGEKNSLLIKTGEGKYDYNTKNIDATNVNPNSPSSAPVFAIDASALAKIQAGQIYLIATKNGVGVKMEGEILASQTLNLDANGDIYYKKISAGDNANLKASGAVKNIDAEASIIAPNIDIQAKNFDNSALISAYNINIKNGENFNNSGNLEALNLNFSNINNIVNSGRIFGKNYLNIAGQNLTNNSAGSIYSPQDYSIVLTGFLNNSGSISAKNNLNIQAQSLTNNSKIYAQNNLDFLIADSANNLGNLIAVNALNFTANSLTNSGEIKSGENSKFNLSALTNSANSLIYSDAFLDLNLNDRFDNSGLISSQNNLTIAGNSAIINDNKILSNGALSISASSLNNNSFSNIASLFDEINLAIINDFTNNGQVSSAKNLSIFANNFTNFGDVLADSKLITTIANQITNFGNFQSLLESKIIASTIDNYGSIKSFDASTISAHKITNKNNATIYSRLDNAISASSLYNDGSILSDANLTINSGLTSNIGEIFANKNLLLTLTDSFTNQGNLGAVDNLTINSDDAIINDNKILSNGNLKIVATSLNNSSKIESNGNIAIILNNLSNSKNISANRDLNIVADASVSNSGTMQSVESFNIETNNFSNLSKSLIIAGGNLKIRASAINNQNTKSVDSYITSGIVSANGAVNIFTDNLNNNAGIIAGKSTSLSALNNASVNLQNNLGSFISTAEIILNLGNLDYTITGTITASNIDITANNIANQGNVTASDFINLNATGASGVAGSGNITNGFVDGDNSNVLLASGSYINLIAKNNINNYGKIIGTTDITLTASNGNVNNYGAGAITGGSGTVIVNAWNGAFNNNAQTALFTADYDAIFNAKDLNNFGEISVANDLTTNITNNLINNPTALIWSGRDATFNVANIFLNNQADIYADRNLTIQKNNSLDPTQNKTNLVQNISGSIETYSGDINIKAVTLENKRSSMKTQGADFVYGQAYVRGGDCHRNRLGRKKCNPIIYRDLHARNIYGVAGLEASVLSGGGINITSNSLLNDASSIISSANFGINTSIFNNNSYSFVQYDDTSTRYEYYNSFIKSGGALTITQNGASNPSLINGGNVAQYVSPAGNSKNTQDTSIDNIDIYKLAQTGVLAVDLSSIINVIKNSGSSGEIAKSAIVNANEASLTSTSTPNFIFSGNFKINLDPSAIAPLVESRGQFTDVSKFFGSKYYFDQLGLNGSAVLADIDHQTRSDNIRMLGDSFVESKLIIDQLKKLTKDSLFLSKTTTDPNQQIKELLDNSVNQFATLGLNAKDVAMNGLTADQANSLSKDIVTFELANVNGVQVLAPKIYLSQDTRNRLFNSDSVNASPALANSSTIFAKENLTIDSPNASLINNGSIVSGGDLAMNIASLTNKTNSMAQAQIIAGDNLSITAQEGDIKNIGAKVGAVGALDLNALKGNILNSAIVQTNDQNLLNQNADSYQLAIDDTAKSSGNITSTLLHDASFKGGSIAINAGNDFTNLGAEISTAKNTLADGSITSGNLSITAGDDINIATLQLRNREESSWGNRKKGGTLVVDQTKNIGSDIESAGSLSLMTTGVGVDSATDSTIADLKSDINIIGSDIVAKENMNLVAKDDVNILSTIDTYHKEEKSHKKGFMVKKSYEAITDETTNVSSNLTSGGDINISSGNDTNILASNLTGAGSGDILVGAYTDLDNDSSTYGQSIYNDDASLNIMNGIDTKRFYSESTKTKIGLSLENALMTAAMVGAVALSGGAGAGVILASGAVGGAVGSVNKQKTTKTEIHYDETIIGSKLNFGNNLTLSSMNDVNLRATKVETGGDIEINAVNNLAIATASEVHQASYDLKDKGNYFFKNGQSGNYNTDVVNTEITSNDGTNSNLAFNVGNATVAQYNKASGDNTNGVTKTGFDGSILYGDFSENSKLAYLEKLDSSKTIYDSVEEINKSWDQTNRGLTKAGQAVVAITATALTMGAMDPVSGSLIQGALVAGASATASTTSISATNSAMNADGDLSKQLKTISKDSWDNTTSEESVKNIAIASLAGGLTVGLTNVINSGSFVAPATTTTASTLTTNASALERIGNNLKNSFQEVAINTVASSASQSAINGDSFSDSLKAQGKNVLIYTLAKVGANEIGRAYHGTTTLDANGNVIDKTPPTIGKSEQLLLHAGLGAITSSLTGNDAMSGAIAGVAGELTAEIANENGAGVATSIQLANLAGAISSVTYGGLTNQSDDEMANNAWEGSRIATNAAQNNFAFVPTAIVGGVVGATGATAGAYMEGERDPKKLAIAAGIGGAIGVASGAAFQPEGVIAGIRTGATVGMIGGGIEGATTTKLINPNATFNDVANGFVKGSISGGIGGAVGGGFGGVIGATGASGYATESVSAMMGLGAGITASAITTNYNFYNTQNQHQYIDYAPKNFANNNPIFLLSPNFNTQSNLIKTY